MQRRLRFALDFFLVGAAVPLVLLFVWQTFFANARLIVQDRFLQVAMVLWPTGLQILVVPHWHGIYGMAFTIAILVVQNAILYSIIALVVHWLVARVRHSRIPQVH